MAHLNIAILGLIAIAIVALNVALSKVRDDLKEGREKLTSELSEIKKLLQK